MIYNIFIGTGVVAILVVLFAERQYQRKKKVQLYGIADTVTNTACGISDRVFNIFLDTIQFVIWSHLYTYVALIQFPSNVFTWFLCLFVVDFIWYWYHRLGHEVRLFWAVHSLHHQSEEFNISVGFRISIFQSILRGVFWLLLPILGFHPELILTVLVFHGLYQLPLHTKVMKHIPWLEYIFVTPSAHRVHHGINEQYLDKNYGGVFMFWDRMFGTFVEETKADKPIYGVVSNIHTFNPFRIAFHEWVGMARDIGLAEIDLAAVSDLTKYYSLGLTSNGGGTATILAGATALVLDPVFAP
jgi:sterol desaturase/sphingolipid hydroxylase (fatty acid hydroxylase superfamily)